MCRFLSLVENDRRKFYLFTPEQRIENIKKPLTDKNGNAYQMDSHASICAYYGLNEDEVNRYEWNPYTEKLYIDKKVFDVDEERVQAYLSGIDWQTICGNIEGLKAFCERMKRTHFFEMCASLPDGVKLFKDRVSAWDAARDSDWDAAATAAWSAANDAIRDTAREAAMLAAWDAAWNAAWNAALISAWNAANEDISDTAREAATLAASDATRYAIITYMCDGLPIDAKHVEHLKKRWTVLEAGYGVVCDVGGMLYCYEKP